MSEPFVARLLPSDVVRRDASTGKRATIMPNCLVEREGAEPVVRTVAVFGQANAAISRRLVAGRPITLLCRFDGGSVRALGWPPKDPAGPKDSK